MSFWCDLLDGVIIDLHKAVVAQGFLDELIDIASLNFNFNVAVIKVLGIAGQIVTVGDVHEFPAETDTLNDALIDNIIAFHNSILIQKTSLSYSDWFMLLDRFEIGCPVFAQRTDEIIRQFIGFQDIATDLADEAFLALGLRFRFDVVLIVGISHRINVVDDSCFSYRTDKHAVSSHVYVVFHLEREEGVDVARKEDQSVVGT